MLPAIGPFFWVRKFLRRAFAQAYAAVLYYRYIILKQRFGADAAFQWASEAAAGHRGDRGVLIRRALLSRWHRVAAADVIIGDGTIFTKKTMSIGSRVDIGARCVLGSVLLGDDVSIGDGVMIPSGKRQHGTRTDLPMRQQLGTFTTVHLGTGCRIGSGAVLLADICDCAVIPPGAVVTRPITAGDALSCAWLDRPQ